MRFVYIFSQPVAYPFILRERSFRKKEGAPSLRNNMDGTGEYYAK